MGRENCGTDPTITAVIVSNIANVLYGTAKLVIPCLFRVTVV
jgi:hypothetical protein